MAGRQTLITTGLEDAIAAARDAADGKDVALMGGVLVTEALQDGAGRRADPAPGARPARRRPPLLPQPPEHVHLRLLEAIPAPGVTHLHYEVVR